MTKLQDLSSSHRTALIIYMKFFLSYLQFDLINLMWVLRTLDGRILSSSRIYFYLQAYDFQQHNLFRNLFRLNYIFLTFSPTHPPIPETVFLLQPFTKKFLILFTILLRIFHKLDLSLFRLIVIFSLL